MDYKIMLVSSSNYGSYLTVLRFIFPICKMGILRPLQAIRDKWGDFGIVFGTN